MNDIFNNRNSNKILLVYFSLAGACIASRYAIMETKVIIYYLLLNFIIEKNSKTPNPLKLAHRPLDMDAKNGFHITLKRRQS